MRKGTLEEGYNEKDATQSSTDLVGTKRTGVCWERGRREILGEGEKVI